MACRAAFGYFWTAKHPLQRRFAQPVRHCTSLVKSVKISAAPQALQKNQTSFNTQTSLNVALVGSPNAGKSLILNRLLDTSVSAVSPKVNTTRSAIHGIKSCSRSGTQLVFVDLPGFVEPSAHNKKLFVSPLRKTVEDALVTEQLDAIMLVVDAAKHPRSFEWAVVERLATVLASARPAARVPCFLVLNKMDLIKGGRLGRFQQQVLNPFVDTLNKRAAVEFPHLPSDDSIHARGFDSTFHVSAKKRWGLKELQTELRRHAVPRTWDYELDEVTSLSLEERVSEIIRGHMFRRLNSEVPYRAEQLVLETIAKPDGTLVVRHQIRVGSKSHHRIVRSAAPFIERAATQDLQSSLGRSVELLLSVKLRR